MMRVAVRRGLRAWGGLVVAFAGLAGWSAAHAAAPSPTTPPVVPGYERMIEAKADGAGELLLGELNCLSCHKPEQNLRVQLRPAPDLSAAGARMTPQFLRSYLAAPNAAKPGTVMPDVFHASAPEAAAGAVEALTHYLVSLGGPIKPATQEGTKLDVEAGDKLFHSVGCVACHAPRDKHGKPIETKSLSVPLPDLASKTTVDKLAAFLLEPHTVRPSGRMPSLNLSSGEAKALAVYLLKDQLDNPQTQEGPAIAMNGLKLTYWETSVKNCNLATLDKIKEKPKATGRATAINEKIPGARSSDWVAKFAGAITIAKAGKYTFYTTSDDGSRLYVDGKQVIDNDGIHPAEEKKGQIELTAGSHPFVVTFFQGGGGAELKVEWQGPGIKRGEIPGDVLTSVDGKPMVPTGSEQFTLDPQKVQMGGMMFSMLGCAACHKVPGQESKRPYKPLAGLNVDSPEGCLGDNIKKGVPNYHLTDGQRTALKGTVKDAVALAKPLGAKEQVAHTMAALNCYACHKRDKVGGPPEERNGYFTMTAEFDMGDEGRLPPTLSGIGAKLRADAIEKIVCEGKLHIRPVLATRMPRFEKEPAAALLSSLPVVDSPPGQPAPPAFAEQAAKDGRTLFGVRGLGCVNCHGVLGNKSLGMPAPDLTTVRDRLQYSWFNRLLHDPNAVVPDTRMPGFWPGDVVQLKGVGGDTAQGQIDATWHYLTLGTSMALPSGLQPNVKSELTPADEPILHRTFMADVGPRAVLVGYPEQLNIAFDANLVRLATVWRGRFFDTKGMWESRGGQALGPLGTDVVKLPALPTFATLADAKAAWPKPQPDPEDGKIARNIGGVFKGYALDKEKRPTFHYVLGGVDIHEQPLPRLQPGGANLVRKFELAGKAENLYLLAATGKAIDTKDDGFLIDGRVTVRVVPAAGSTLALKPLVRDAGGGGKELVVPLGTLSGKASFDVEMSW